MYSLSQLRTITDDPRWLVRELIRAWNHLTSREPYNSKGIDIFSRDWDVLIVLDACRYDEFERACDIDGELSKVESRGATSSEFVRGNFSDRVIDDMVYVSANGHYLWLRDDINAEIYQFIGLHEGQYRDAVGGLTTRPETVTKHAIRVREENPNKRMIVHYLQPHQPYLGSCGRTHISHEGGLINTVRANDLSRETLLRAYRENLDLVLNEVEEILDHMEGKIAVTSDHGEMLGERLPLVPIRDYGHFEGVYTEELLAVPWFVVENGSRPRIVPESTTGETDAYDREEVAKHLNALGYRT